MPQFSIDEIFRSPDTKHRLTLFKAEDVQWLETQLFEKNGKPYLKCLASDKDRPAKPEEIVRQLWIKKLLDEYHYPKARLKIEYAVWFGSGVSDKSADIVIMQTDGEHPYIIFEVKKPKRKDGLQQLKSYCNAEGSPIGAWSNGEELVILHREEPNVFSQISSIPTVGQTLQDVITEQWTIDKLTEENRLVKERLSLKKIILDLEDLVLANAEGIDDSFDEVFKLIYAKLYDEWAATNDRTRNRKIHFRIYGESPRELYEKINGLFNRAKDKWRGIFGRDESIRLKPEHLLTCVSFLQDVKLFNANLQVIDEAFEYLITEVAKGKKGQYFTPRWVIDMSVKMLNPRIHERVIDTACGSSGFTVHSIFWVAGDQFTTNGFPPAITEYAGTMVYAIDSSPKAVKIAKALNLIAGDGKSNVYELNSLNPPKWSDEGKAAFRPLLTRLEDRNQGLWSSVLAGEANAPGTYSKRTVNFLGDLDKKDAELFQALCSFGWIIGNFTPLVFSPQDNVYNDRGLNFNTLTHLDSIGLIQFNSLSGFRRTGLTKTFTVRYCQQPLVLTMEKESENQLPIGNILLTKVGEELATVCKAPGVDGFVDYVKEKWKQYLPDANKTEQDGAADADKPRG